jgi:hypothetical protein
MLERNLLKTGDLVALLNLQRFTKNGKQDANMPPAALADEPEPAQRGSGYAAAPRQPAKLASKSSTKS